jgi:hypothetical protein
MVTRCPDLSLPRQTLPTGSAANWLGQRSALADRNPGGRPREREVCDPEHLSLYSQSFKGLWKKQKERFD